LKKIRGFKESRPSTPLYHFGSESTLESIVAFDKLGFTPWEANINNEMNSELRSEIFNDWISGGQTPKFATSLYVKPNQVSFTRDKHHIFSTNKRVMIVVNQELLSYNYRLKPTRGDYSDQSVSEAEERINSVIHDIHKYITDIYIYPSFWKSFNFGKDLPSEAYNEPPEGTDMSSKELEYFEKLDSVTTDDVEKYCTKYRINLVIKKF